MKFLEEENDGKERHVGDSVEGRELSGERVEVRDCSADHITRALSSGRRAGCGPMEKIVKLVLPGNISYSQMSPSHLVVRQCGGGCHNTHHSCVSTAQVRRKVPVMVSRCGLGTGLCQKVCAEVEVMEDSRCSCSCLDRQNTCGPLHTFNRQTCSCDCKDHHQYKACR